MKLVQWIRWLLAVLLSCVGGFLSLWIVIPAPIFSLLPLGVGAPEISPWLVGVNGGAILLLLLGKGKWVPGKALHRKAFHRKVFHYGTQLLLVLSTLALILSLLPLLQFPAAQQRAAQAMEQTLGQNYLAQIPESMQAQMRSHPLILPDVFRGIPAPEVREQRGIVFARPQGVPLEMIVYRPVTVGLYPGVVMIYGGAWQWGAPEANAAFGRYLAAQGYVVWAIDYRHAPQHQFPAQLEDVQTALNFIGQHASEYETDLNRLALMGRSAGAHLAMLAAYQSETLPVRAVVSYYGPVDLTAGYYDLPHPDPIDARARLRALLGGTPEEKLALYQQASPVEWVRPLQGESRGRKLPPTLLIYGRRDHLVQAKFGRGMATKLQQAGNQATFIEVPWAEHAFDLVFQGLGSQLALYHTERFLAWALRP